MILGADAMSVGRLYVYGLAAAGAPGIVRLLEILENEIQTCLALLGVTSFAAPDNLPLPGPAGGDPARPQRLPLSRPAARDLLAGGRERPPDSRCRT